MRRRSRAGGEPVKTRRRKTATLKRRNAPKAGVRRSSAAADQQTKVALFKRERDEALEQLSAASEVLKVISSSPRDSQKAMASALLRYVTRRPGLPMPCAKHWSGLIQRPLSVAY
jgi:hypothetical protein